MKTFTTALLSLLILIASTGPLPAAEGKWVPDQLANMDPEKLRAMGLQLPADAIWSADGSGLLRAVANLGGCTAAFVSDRGLLITNHHCAFGLIQKHSTPDRDLLEDGFLAESPDEELPGEGVRISVPLALSDVSARVEASIPEGADDLERWRAVEKTRKQIVAECERAPGRRCSVRSEDDGVRYMLEEAVEFSDVRLVWSPPRMVGEFGGEVDNWSWPRHSGDVALLRVWADADNRPAAFADDNRPYEPEQWFRISTEDLDEGDFIMVGGFPYSTSRRLIAAERALLLKRYFPGRSDLYRHWIGIMEAAAELDDGARLAVASRIKQLANREKNARGQIAGYGRGRLVERAEQLEQEILAWAGDGTDGSRVAEAHAGLIELAADKARTWDRDFLMAQISVSSLPLDSAFRIVRWAREQEKPDLDRLQGYQQRDRDRIEDRLRVAQKRYQSQADLDLLTDLLERFEALTDDQRPQAFQSFQRPEGGWSALAAEVLGATRVTDLDRRMAMLDLSLEELEALDDPLIDLAMRFETATREVEEDQDRRKGTASRLRPTWRRAMAAHRGSPLDPDANAGLRVSLAHVRGYSPEDAVWMRPQTTVAGMIAKHTGEDPFAVPAQVLESAPSAPDGRWRDPELGDVPLAFLADADTTGGNSGSRCSTAAAGWSASTSTGSGRTSPTMPATTPTSPATSASTRATSCGSWTKSKGRSISSRNWVWNHCRRHHELSVMPSAFIRR
jgi:hypothetical protein